MAPRSVRASALAAFAAALLTLAVVVPTGPATARAAAPTPTSTTLDVGAPGYAGEPVRLRARVTDRDGVPVEGTRVRFARLVDGVWRVVGAGDTDADGKVDTTVVRSREAADNVFRAVHGADAATGASGSGRVVSGLRRRSAVVGLTGPDSVVDERSVTLRLAWHTGEGEAVSGRTRVLQRTARRGWTLLDVARTGADGTATLRVRPRVDTRYRAVTPASDWLGAGHSRVLMVHNQPPMTPVRLPKAAPHPRRHVPAQPRATGRGAHPVITTIPNRVWHQMVGRTWHSGCPVGRSGLRLLRISYWGFDGYRHRGELVAATTAVDNMSRALAAMYDQRLPIRSIYREDRFGWSPRVHGADDFASMAAGNTSAFNCRSVVNNPGVRSPHSYGRALDLNTWENPYRSSRGIVPNTWWQSHSHPLVAWRSSRHRVVRIMNAHGLRWTYGLGDTQHFDVATGNGRVLLPPGCRGGAVCD